MGDALHQYASAATANARVALSPQQVRETCTKGLLCIYGTTTAIRVYSGFTCTGIT